jgi:nitroreductase
MNDFIGRLQQSAHTTPDDHAAHAIHAAVVELRRINADAEGLRVMLLKAEKKYETMQTLIAALRDVNASQDRERYSCGGMIDEMAAQRECAKAFMARAVNAIDGGEANGR